MRRGEMRANLFATFFSTRDFDGSKFQFVKKIFKWLAIAFLFVIVSFGGCIYYFAPRPPKEAKLIQNFNEHRTVFEQLRDMLQADTNLVRVTSWGVETRKPFFLGYPSDGNFPTDRFNQYLALLKQANGKLAYREEGKDPDCGVDVWVWGGAGYSKHIGICWMDEAPTNQINTLDSYGFHSHFPTLQVVYRHIDQNWYLWTDQ
jgi:hypothetical protein